MVKIVWSPQSLADLENIADYIARDSFHYAKLVVEKIVKMEFHDWEQEQQWPGT
ncbi:MAG: type II toxin-antitoxin system RelE/ParE family toxin [bacterium]